MSDSICRFMPTKNRSWDIKPVHFVYESDFHAMKQPFLRPIYYLHLVTSGSAVMRIYDKEYPLEKGTLFFTFPAVPTYVTASEDFKYLYISFMGAGVPSLLEGMGIGIHAPVYPNYAHLTDLWMSSIVRADEANADLLSEGVLAYTLSYLTPSAEKRQSKHSEQFLLLLSDYVRSNYRDPELSLKKLSGIFSYTEKYISYLFKKHMKVGFNRYLNDLRIRHATELLTTGGATVSEVAFLCGYRDPLYFSRIFKRSTGFAPSDYPHRAARP